MLDLVKEGLVEPVRNRGFRVTELSDKALDDITELRALIEGSDRRRDRDLRGSRGTRSAASVRELDRRLCPGRRPDRLHPRGSHLHLRLLGFAGNERLVEVVRDLRDRTRLYGLERMVRQGRLVDSAQEHLELLDALLAHDSDSARDVMARHIAHIRGIWSARPDPGLCGVAVEPQRCPSSQSRMRCRRSILWAGVPASV